MSKSYKKTPIAKGGRWMKEKYWSTVRSHWKNQIKSGVHPEDVDNPKTIVNDYDHCDYIFTCYEENCHCMDKYGFKKCVNK